MPGFFLPITHNIFLRIFREFCWIVPFRNYCYSIIPSVHISKFHLNWNRHLFRLRDRYDYLRGKREIIIIIIKSKMPFYWILIGFSSLSPSACPFILFTDNTYCKRNSGRGYMWLICQFVWCSSFFFSHLCLNYIPSCSTYEVSLFIATCPHRYSRQVQKNTKYARLLL